MCSFLALFISLENFQFKFKFVIIEMVLSDMWGTQYAKLKTNLKLASNRLKLLQKKKTELAMKARTEIVDFVTCKLIFIYEFLLIIFNL